MPKFSSLIDTNRIPVKGLIPEVSATAPSSPVQGLLWLDSSTTPRTLKVWDGSAWAITNLYAGTGAGSYAAGDDTRIVGAAQKSANLSDLASVTTARTNLGLGGAAVLSVGTGAGTVAAGDDSRIVGAAQKANNLSDLANAGTARTNLGLGTAATTNTGTGATNTILGNDARLTDQRVPTDASVTGGTAGTGVKIAANTITDVNVAAANKDGVAGTASLRTLGTGSQQALAGNTRLDQITAPTTSVDLNGQKITGLGAPTLTSDAARLADVQASQAGIDNKPSARIVATSNVGLTGLTAIDGVTPVGGDRVLVVAQTTPSQNGIYVAAAGAWARDTDTITPQTFWMIEEGTTYAGSQWKVNTPGPITVGTTSLTINQWGAAGTTYTGTTNRITVSGATIDIAGTYAGQSSIVTVGTITTGVWNGTAIGVAYGGTGAGTAAAARTNLGVAQKGYAQDLGAITGGTPLVVTHSLGTQDVITQIRDTATQEVVIVDVLNSSATTVSVRSDLSYASGALRIVVIPAV